MKNRSVDVAVLGAGTAGLVALSALRKQTERFVLIDPGPLGTTCARVGCMPSKALIQIAEDLHRRKAWPDHGLPGGGDVVIDSVKVMARVRALRDRFAGAMVAKTERFGDALIREKARMVSPDRIVAGEWHIQAGAVVIAVGSHPYLPAEWAAMGPGILTSDTVFELERLPKSMAVIGLGVIGCELGQAMARLGVDVVGLSRSNRLGGAHDPEILEAAAAELAKDMTLWQGASPRVEKTGDGFRVHSGSRTRTVETVLVAMGRRSNASGMGLENLGLPLDAQGLPPFDRTTLRVGDLPVYIAGDVHGEWPIMHEAWDDGRVAGYNALRTNPACFRRRTPLAITFTSPQIARAGRARDDLEQGTFVETRVGFEDHGRAILMGEAHGAMKLYAHRASGRLLGAEFCAPRAEHMAHLLAWAIQQNMTVHDVLKMPYYHPVLEEALNEGFQQLARALPAIEDPLEMSLCEPSPTDALT